MLAVIASICLGIAIAVRPGSATLELDVYLLGVGALALLATIARTIGTLPRERPSPLDLRLPHTRPEPLPPDLAKLGREVGLSTETAFDAHFRLRPTLRRIATARLRARGVELDTGGARAESLLGPQGWELTRPDRARPRRHDGPGTSLADIDAAVTALERL